MKVFVKLVVLLIDMSFWHKNTNQKEQLTPIMICAKTQI